MPKIIDFGVAKALAQPLTERTLLTEDSQLLGTPEYMSPEQADMAREDIDTVPISIHWVCFSMNY